MTLRLRYVAGVSPAKWLRAWAERRPDLLDGAADVAFVRLPVPEEGLHRIPLWEEVAVALLPKDHPLADAESLTLADLDGEPVAPEQADPAMTVELVAAGTGYAILPHSLARLHHRRDVTAVPVTDATPTRIALAWRVERDDADIQEFVGVVRGRTARSSRGEAGDDAAASADSAESARGGKASAKAGSASARSGAAGKAAGRGRAGGRGASARSGRTPRRRGGRGR